MIFEPLTIAIFQLCLLPKMRLSLDLEGRYTGYKWTLKKDGNGIVVSSDSLSISENAKCRIHLRFEFYDLKSKIQVIKFKNMKFGENFQQ